MRKQKVIILHILTWAFYVLYELAVIQLSAGLHLSPWRYLVFYFMNILLFYFNAHVVLDYAFFKTPRPYLTATLLIFLEIIAYLYLKLELDNQFSGGKGISLALHPENMRLWLTNVFREIFFIGFSTAYWSLLYMMKFREKNHALEKEVLIAENAYLQSQISPHFLFNTLNFLYTSVYRVSEAAGEGIMLLSDIMRYSLKIKSDQHSVPLKKEVEQIRKLIRLSRLRFGEQFYLAFQRKGSSKDINILPLLLLTLVENMIKHGDLGEPAYPGEISLEVSARQLRFRTCNRKRQSTPYHTTGIGLANIEKRLHNHYPGRYTFEITDTNETFAVFLILDL